MDRATKPYEAIAASAGHPAIAGRSHRSAFTLIELLVVIAIMALLMSMLIPSMAVAREQARRIVCRSNIRQFMLGIQLYAENNEERLPSGLSDSGSDEHTPVLSRKTRAALVRTAGSHKVLMCPWLGEPFTDPDGWYYHGYGYVIGYNYLGGHEGTPWPLIWMAEAEWISPQFSTDNGRLPIVTELNAWSEGSNQTFAPHGRTGPILEYSVSGYGGIPSQEIGAAGGNIGYLDGSTSWKDMADMKIYRGSRSHGSRGCFTAW